jgi:KDO2-lipid IV(A) lauroyltransferase
MRVFESPLRDLSRLAVWYPVRWVAGALPIPWAFRMFAAMGDCHAIAGGRTKRAVAQAAREIFDLGPQATRKLVSRYFENHYVDRLHIFLYPRLVQGDRVGACVRFENLELLDRTVATGRGALLVQPHFGPVQLTLLALARRGHRPVQIGNPSDKGLSRVGRAVAYRLRLRYEAMIPAPIVPADGYLGNTFRHLRDGGVVLTTGDGAGGGVFLGEHRSFTFLGRDRLFPLGPASLALRTGAAFLPTFILPEGHGRYRVVFEPPVEPGGTDRRQESLRMTESFVATMERYVRRYPCCWHFLDELAAGPALPAGPQRR